MLEFAPPGAAAGVADPPDPARDATGASLMIVPSVVIENLEPGFVVAFEPLRGVRLRLGRPVYEIFRRFALPQWVDDVLPAEPERREKARQAVGYLRQRGLLAPPPEAIAGAAAPP